jgi:hypothetical protein
MECQKVSKLPLNVPFKEVGYKAPVEPHGCHNDPIVFCFFSPPLIFFGGTDELMKTKSSVGRKLSPFLFMFANVYISESFSELSRDKRSILQLGRMLECSTKRSRWDYNGYGCYCGYGGSGTPLDDTDR